MRFILALLLGASISHAHPNCGSSIQHQLERERTEDLKTHECRACGEIDVWADGNCPEMGYECDEALAITTRVQSPTDCNCAQLRCRDTHAFIAVNGQIAGKLHCMDRKWWTPYQETESAVCARSCGINVCPLQPARYFLDNPSHRPLVVSPPDAEHKCAWTECQNGALAKPNDGTPDIAFQGLSQFACSGDRSWTYTGPGAQVRNLKLVVCLSNECQRLPFAGANADCKSKYFCYAPKFENGDEEGSKKMVCDTLNALRSEEDNTEIAPTCKVGVWQDASNQIGSDTKVMCITCPNVVTEPNDKEQPAVAENNKDVTCKNGQLTIEFGDGGGDFGPFNSLEDLVIQKVPWKVRCALLTPGSCKSCAKELVSITKDGPGSHDFEDSDIDSSGACTVLAFTCKGTNANIEFNKGEGVVNDGDDQVTDGFAKLTLVCNADGTAWQTRDSSKREITQVECASTGGLACQALPFEASTAVCPSKYDCYEPEFKKDEVPAIMDCKDPGALRLSEDNTKIAPTCKNGLWTENGSEFGKTTNVMCINCPNFDTDATDEVTPDSDRNRAVTCASGQLTIEYESEGGVFPGYPSFDTLNKAIKWKARCIPPTSGDCKSCTRELISITNVGPGSHDFESDNIDPSGTCDVRTFTCKGNRATIELNSVAGSVSDTDGDGIVTFEVECNADGTAWQSRDSTKLVITQVECASTGQCYTLILYSPLEQCVSWAAIINKCILPEFENGVPAKMTCKDPGALRLSADNTEIAPTCTNGGWTANSDEIGKTTNVMCINCPDIDTDSTDKAQPTSDRNRAVTCSKGQLTIEYESDGPHQTEVTSLSCSPAFAWTATGGTFPPFSSFDALVAQKSSWKARCLSATTGDCQSCTRALITITTSAEGSHDFFSDIIDPSGTCAKRTFTCKGKLSTIELNDKDGVIEDGEDGVDGVARLVVECSADGTAWTYLNIPITNVECASGVPDP